MISKLHAWTSKFVCSPLGGFPVAVLRLIEKWHDKMPQWFYEVIIMMSLAVSSMKYLQGRHCPLVSRWRPKIVFQEIQSEVCAQNWTLVVWVPGGVSFLPGSWSSNKRSGMLYNNIKHHTWVSSGQKLHRSIVCSDRLLPTYSNSSFKAIPLWEKHCWQINAYLNV